VGNKGKEMGSCGFGVGGSGKGNGAVGGSMSAPGCTLRLKLRVTGILGIGCIVGLVGIIGIVGPNIIPAPSNIISIVGRSCL
jgi:hypothetical protein